MKKIAIIGGGPAGLCAARHLLHSKGDVKLQPVIFEQQESIGGTWLYKEVDEKNQKQYIVSSIYKNMKTNLPKQVMCFPDFPFPDADPSYMHHSSVLKYMQNYAEHFKLNQYINFNTKVLSVSPIIQGNATYVEDAEKRFVKWKLESQNLLTNEVMSETFDGVAVCSGHYTVPVVPAIKGIANFKGKTLHSHYYRDPLYYSGKSVVILGNGPSGTDIMNELKNHCSVVYFCHRGGGEPKESKYQANVIELPNIEYVDIDGGFVLTSNYKITADAFILCTGYIYDYPFLSPSSGVLIKHDDRVVTPLYKHLFHTKYPSLVFIGLPWTVTVMPLLHQQCGFVGSIFSKHKKLPCEAEMNKDCEEEFIRNIEAGLPARYFHKFGAKQFTYNKELSLLSGCEENPEVIEKLYKFAHNVRRQNLGNYKSKEYKQIDSKTFICVS